MSVTGLIADNQGSELSAAQTARNPVRCDPGVTLHSGPVDRGATKVLKGLASPAGLRTCDPQFRKLLLYPAELRGHGSNNTAPRLLMPVGGRVPTARSNALNSDRGGNNSFAVRDAPGLQHPRDAGGARRSITAAVP